MVNWDFLLDITKRLVEIGREKREIPPVYEVEPFKHYFDREGNLKYDELDEYDGKFTRREILTRYLLVNVVLDQGPDIVGVRELLKEVTTSLYRKEIRIFHRPTDFFNELNISIDEMISKHNSIKEIRAEKWALENKSSPSKYNLFFTQSMRGIVSTKQVLDYAIHRWGVPLAMFLLLEKDLNSKCESSPQVLVDYLESYSSAEIMSQQLKDNERYGLGSAIGYKGCHLFAKLYVSTFGLVKHRKDDKGWTGISYEVPLDSNAGRVLFRTGFLLELATLKDYEKWNVIQKGKGKGGVNYIRVTNIRGKKVKGISTDSEFFHDYLVVVREYLKMGKPRSMEIQRVPNLLIYKLNKDGYDFSVGDFDDGLMYIGTKYCYNHDEPKCEDCPLNDVCRGYNKDNTLIKNYRT